MKQLLISTIFFCLSIQLFSQKDSLQLGDRYREDQLYFNITYNVLNKQPAGVGESGFSYGLAGGYIRDISLNRRGNLAAGIGVGYNYNSFSHGLLVDKNGDFTLDSGSLSNKIRLHNIEFPIQLRWRTSDAVTYSFWRIYAGVRLSYNINNKFKYTINNQKYEFNNINSFNKFQSGLEVSAGYGAFNFFIYYGFVPMYEDAIIEGEKINTRIRKFGLIFYLL